MADPVADLYVLRFEKRRYSEHCGPPRRGNSKNSIHSYFHEINSRLKWTAAKEESNGVVSSTETEHLGIWTTRLFVQDCLNEGFWSLFPIRWLEFQIC